MITQFFKRKKKWSHFDLKSWVTGGTKIQPGIPNTDSQYLNIEYNWLPISSQFDYQYRVKLTITIESNWLSLSSQIDYQYRVNLTQIFSNYSETRVEFQFRQWLNFLGQNDSIFSFSVSSIYFDFLKRLIFGHT